MPSAPGVLVSFARQIGGGETRTSPSACLQGRGGLMVGVDPLGNNSLLKTLDDGA